MRALHGVAQHFETISFFAKPSQGLARDLQSLISLKEYSARGDWRDTGYLTALHFF